MIPFATGLVVVAAVLAAVLCELLRVENHRLRDELWQARRELAAMRAELNDAGAAATAAIDDFWGELASLGGDPHPFSQAELN